MTWYFDPDGQSYDAYDPSGDLFVTGKSFDGIWEGQAPEDFYSEASVHLETAPDMQTGLRWIGELIADDIEQGTP